jgi:hypothetical protein
MDLDQRAGRMHKHLLTIFVLFLVGRVDAAAACSFGGPIPSDEELSAKASTIFVGHLMRTEEAGMASIGNSPPAPMVEGTFRVVEVIKGQAPPDGKVRTPVRGIVCMPLLAGLDYLVFLFEDNFIRGAGEGTRPIIDVESVQEKRQLDKLRTLNRKAR